jgi:hypothetical protein
MNTCHCIAAHSPHFSIFPAHFFLFRFLGLFHSWCFLGGNHSLVSAGGLPGVYLSLVGAWHGVRWFEDLNNLGNIQLPC